MHAHYICIIVSLNSGILYTTSVLIFDGAFACDTLRVLHRVLDLAI